MSLRSPEFDAELARGSEIDMNFSSMFDSIADDVVSDAIEFSDIDAVIRSNYRVVDVVT